MELKPPNEVDIDLVCRLCANVEKNHLVPLFEGEGLENNLPDKISKYLDFSVHMKTGMPSAACLPCTMSLLNWHTFYKNCETINERFREMLKKPLTDSKLIHPPDGNVSEVADDVCIDFDEDSSAFNKILNEAEIIELEKNGDNDNVLITIEEDEEAVEQQDLQSDALPTEVLDKILEQVDEEPETDQRKSGRRKLPRVAEEEEDNISSAFYVNAENMGHTLGVDVLVQEGDSGPGMLNGIINCDTRVIEEDVNVILEKGDAIEAKGNKDDEEEIMFSIMDKKLSKAISPTPEVPSNKPSCSTAVALSLSEDPLACPDCTSVFKKSSDLIQHMTLQHGYNESQLIATIVKLDRKVIDAAEVIKNGQKLYKCAECAKFLKSINSFNWHALIHKDEKYFRCSLCEKTFRLQAGLTRHIKEFHYKIKTFACEECGSTFANSTNLQEHQNIHTGVRPFQCKDCGKSFKQKSSLFVHKRTHSQTYAFHCDVCQAGFRTRPVLVQHKRIHSGEKPFECPVCKRRFRLNYEMNLHRKSVHTDDKPFACTQCAMQFRQRRYLLRHTKKYHPS